MSTVLRSLTSALATLALILGPAAATVADDADRSGPTHESLALGRGGTTVSLGEGVHVVGLRWQGPATAVPELRLREPGGSWTGWRDAGAVVESGLVAQEQVEADRAGALRRGAAPQAAPAADALDPQAVATEGQVVVGPAEVEVRLAGEGRDVTVETWTAYPTSSDARAVADLPVGGPGLVVGTRADWGADESLRGTAPASLVHDAPKLGVTIHHTAGTNGYTAEQVPAILRAIYAYHGQTLGWGDIGYGTLVDRFGRAWEGRAGGVEHNLQLAHAYGMNTDWAGISVLGDHETARVAAAELATLTELTAWTLDTHGADVADEVRYTNETLGWTRTLPVVHGHRDVDATTCPGMHLYALFEQVRAAVAGQQDAGTHAVQRTSGRDRYASAAALAQEAFLEGADTAYLASGTGLVDALAVGPVAAEQDAAVLLTRPDRLPAPTVAALDDLGVTQVRVVGGEAAVSAAVVDELTALGLRVTRLSGSDRYAVAARLAQEAAADGSAPQTVYLASGQELPDALGGAAAAAQRSGAVLLTRSGRLPAPTADALASLRPARVVVLGGDAAVREAVVSRVRTLLPGSAVERIGGADRYATSALVAADAFGTTASAVAAAGTAPADAMAGTQLAARHGSPLVLVRPDCRPRSVDAAYGTLGVQLTRLAGGSAVLDWTAGTTTCG